MVLDGSFMLSYQDFSAWGAGELRRRDRGQEGSKGGNDACQTWARRGALCPASFTAGAGTDGGAAEQRKNIVVDNLDSVAGTCASICLARLLSCV